MSESSDHKVEPHLRRVRRQSGTAGPIGPRHKVARDCRECGIPLRDDVTECPRCGTVPFARGLHRPLPELATASLFVKGDSE